MHQRYNNSREGENPLKHIRIQYKEYGSTVKEIDEYK